MKQAPSLEEMRLLNQIILANYLRSTLYIECRKLKQQQTSYFSLYFSRYERENIRNEQTNT